MFKRGRTSSGFALTTAMVVLLIFCQSPLTGHERNHGALNVDKGAFQDFPAMCTSDSGEALVAYVDRPTDAAPRLIVAVDHHGELEPVFTMADRSLTAFGTPSLVAAKDGCLLVFSAEVKGVWSVGYLSVDHGKAVGKPVYLKLEDAVNVRPAVAVSGDTFCIVWESNAKNKRQIFGCLVRNGKASSPVALSPDGVPAYNPAVTASGTGNQFFVAWDSYLEENSDIYGRQYANGKRGKVERLSNDPRIERYVSLTTAPDGKVWLAWEACTTKELGINNYVDQQIVVAQRTENGLKMPQDLFGKSGPQASKKICRRPVILVDSSGRLHLSFRNNKGEYEGKPNRHSFWTGEFWTYSGTTWHGPHKHDKEWGWWRPIPLDMSSENTLLAAIQEGIGKSHLFTKTSASSISLAQFTIDAALKEAATVPLVMPRTTFSLDPYLKKFSLRLPRQRATHNGKQLNLYWGDLHEHTAMSQCARTLNPPAIGLLANQRDIDQLDFTALTDHGYNHCDRSWAYSRELVRTISDPGFIALLGIEWTSAAYGHHNLIFEDTKVKEVYHKSFGQLAPVELYDYIEKNEATSDFISLPHGLSDHNRGKRWQTDWSQVHEVHQPLVEIFQARESFEHSGAPRESRQTKGGPEGFSYQDALEHEVIIGVSASPDHGGTMGRTGVWAPSLTSENLFEAFHNRHTFGTSGAKISLLFRSENHFMGDKVQRVPSKKPISFNLQVNAGAPIKRIVIFRDKKIVHEITAPGDKVDTKWVDNDVPVEERVWYYARVEREDGELAWSSPIWFLSAKQMQNSPTHSTAKPKAEIFKAIDACCPHDTDSKKANDKKKPGKKSDEENGKGKGSAKKVSQRSGRPNLKVIIDAARASDSKAVKEAFKSFVKARDSVKDKQGKERSQITGPAVSNMIQALDKADPNWEKNP